MATLRSLKPNELQNAFKDLNAFSKFKQENPNQTIRLYRNLSEDKDGKLQLRNYDFVTPDPNYALQVETESTNYETNLVCFETKLSNLSMTFDHDFHNYYVEEGLNASLRVINSNDVKVISAYSSDDITKELNGNLINKDYSGDIKDFLTGKYLKNDNLNKGSKFNSVKTGSDRKSYDYSLTKPFYEKGTSIEKDYDNIVKAIEKSPNAHFVLPPSHPLKKQYQSTGRPVGRPLGVKNGEGQTSNQNK